MKNNWFKTVQQTKDIVGVLLEKAKEKSCLDEKKVEQVLNRISWYKLPLIVGELLQNIDIDKFKDTKTLWLNLPQRLETLKTEIEEFDCRSKSQLGSLIKSE